jgi:hypothetical protein
MQATRAKRARSYASKVQSGSRPLQYSAEYYSWRSASAKEKDHAAYAWARRHAPWTLERPQRRY